MEVSATYSLTLSPQIKVQVKKGATVKKGDLLAEGEDQAGFEDYDLAVILKIAPTKVMTCLKKKLGEKVTAGETIACHQNFLGKVKGKFTSAKDGILDSLTQEGKLRFRFSGEKVSYFSPFAGQITQVKNDGLSLSFNAWEVKGSWGSGPQTTGDLTLLPEKKEVDIFDIKEKGENKIFACQGSFSSGFWYKALSLGAVGLVAGCLQDQAFEDEIKKEKLPFLLFGQKEIEKKLWQLFQKNQGQTVLLEGESKRLLLPR